MDLIDLKDKLNWNYEKNKDNALSGKNQKEKVINMENITNIVKKIDENKYSFEKVFWILAWLQFLSYALISLVEYLTAVGLTYEQITFTSLIINIIKGFNIIVIGAMIKFFNSILDKNNEKFIKEREEKSKLEMEKNALELNKKIIEKECCDAQSEILGIKTTLKTLGFLEEVENSKNKIFKNNDENEPQKT